MTVTFVFLWLVARLASAQDVVVAPGPDPHGPPGVACAHCHEDPHEGAGAGGCQRCHGTEAWAPPVFTVDEHTATKFPLEGRHQRVACGLCHVNAKLVGLPTTCNGCHLDRHRGKLGDDCAACHAPTGFVPTTVPFDHLARTGFALAPPHELSPEGLGCPACHDGANGQAMRLVPTATCETCHAAGHGSFAREGDCASCHPVDGAKAVATFAAATFDHRREAAFPLERRHAVVACAGCHPVDAPMPDASCGACHTDVHTGQLGLDCASCHRPDRWRVVRFDHDLTTWPLRGRHFVTPCASCHTSGRWIGLPDACWDCHAFDLARAPASVPAHTVGLPDCSDCHGTWSWR